MEVIAVDTGNKQIKTDHYTFISGLSLHSTVPATVQLEDYIKYEGRYHVLSNRREEYLRDKSVSDRYFFLSLFAIVKELDYRAEHKEILYSKDKVYCVTMLCGLPPAHMEDEGLKKKYKNYFKMKEPEKITYKGRVWNIKINKVYVYAQCYAAMMTVFPQIKDQPRVLGIDIGGFTADYMILKRGRIDIESTDSLENGVIILYRTVRKECAKKYDTIIEESDVDEILKGNTEMYAGEVVDEVYWQAQKFVDRLLASFREFQIDIKNSYVVFMGGGSMLLKEFIEKSDLIKKYTFIEGVNANVSGYKFLYSITQRKQLR